MIQKITSEQEKELLEILDLAKIAEDKLKDMSDFATSIVDKQEKWYKSRLQTQPSQKKD